MLNDRLCLKYGRRVHLSEASTMRFISEHTSIPVPKVLCAFTRSGWTYIVIERIQGHIVGFVDWETAGWYPSYWEYTSAHQVNPQDSFWVNEIDKSLQAMPEELAMERAHQVYYEDV